MIDLRKIAKKQLFPTSNVHISRLILFEATRRPKYKHRDFKTSWGRAEVKGKLGQVHADLMEAITSNAIDGYETEEGDLIVLVDPYVIRKSMGKDGTPYSQSTLMDKVEDLKSAVITLHINRDDNETPYFLLDGILVRIEPSKRSVINKLNGKKRFFWKVTLTKTYKEIMMTDIPMYYDPHLLVGLSGVSQGLVRHIYTHKGTPNGGWFLDNLLERVGVDIGNSNELKNRHRELKKDADLLLNLGINIENGRVVNTKTV